MRYWINELWRLGYLLFGLGAMGLLLGEFFGSLFAGLGWGVAAGLGLYVFLHLRHVRLLYIWLLRHPREAPPPGTGVWGDLFDRLYSYQKAQSQLQQRLRDILRRIQDSCEAMRDSVVMLDPQGDLDWWNSAASEMLGLKADHDRGQPLTNYLRDPRFIDYFEAGDYREPLLLPSPIHDNRMLQFQLTLYGDNERLVMARDITRLHQLEMMRRDFVANVSHELRTPLTVLAGYLETYSDNADMLPERWQRGFNQMQAQTTRMQNLVEDLLLLSRLEIDTPDADSDPVDVPALLESIVEDARGLSGGRQTLLLEVDEPRRLLANTKEIRSAISNLAFNAVRYTPAGSTIVLRWKSWHDGAAIEVEDDGEGFDPVHIPRLTERFYRIDKGRSAATGGTGLGLAIVKHVMLRHGAKLDIVSRPGKGARFRCAFPLSRLQVSPLSGTDDL
ncbi:phosphate regulon sensor histidine kinase PhoR [Salinicola rhizosphaerae]|uniref:Phosphate regulon sensor protein PhoR n=1 Tax=Salinicola rhizosphaerae TaxID=1443141 RepID=A0ABQ3DS09_9GAMM|nr:phosphate regulon sensor histidine kinase PhoR [Salinicola rhizosphaerae]GHB13709.1 phosphate regulon sensor protein PhoR [Salinicola rhizosphaerae]